MKIARVSILGSLIWIGLFGGGSTLAQQPHSTPEAIPPGPWQPEAMAAESVGIPPGAILGTPNPGIPFEETVDLHGGTYGPCALGPACAVCGGGSSDPPSWYTQQNVNIWTRSRSRRTPLTNDFDIQVFSDPANPDLNINFAVVRELSTTRDFTFDATPAYDMLVGHHLGRDTENRDHFVEFEFAGLRNWRESLTFLGTLQPTFVSDDPYPPNNLPAVTGFTGSLLSPFRQVTAADAALGLATAGQLLLNDTFNRADRHSQVYMSDLDDFELNVRIRPRANADRLVLHPNGKWRRECRPGEYISYLFGMRVLSVDEQFRFSSDSSRFDSQLQLTQAFTGEYRIRTHNDMFGLQFGGDWMVRRCKWSYGMRIKAGPFFNFSDKDLRLVASGIDFTGPAPVTSELDIQRDSRKNGTALLAEFGFVGTYKIHPNLTLRAAYDFMWLTGLALAPEQLVFAERITSAVNDNGHIYFHGLTLGAEYSF